MPDDYADRVLTIRERRFEVVVVSHEALGDVDARLISEVIERSLGLAHAVMLNAGQLGLLSYEVRAKGPFKGKG